MASKFHLRAYLHFFSHMFQHVAKDAVQAQYIFHQRKAIFSHNNMKNKHTHPPRCVFKWSVQVPLGSIQKISTDFNERS